MSTKKITPGILVSIEGIDGSGKSSVAAFLAEKLQAQNYSVTLTREPGGTALGQQLRNLLNKRKYHVYPEAELLLFAADRGQHMQEIIAPALAEGHIVISDRMADSALAYQGFGRGLDKKFINLINNWAMHSRIPDLVLYIKVDYNTAIERLKARNKQLTVFEQEPALFFSKVIAGFDTIFNQKLNSVTLDGTQPFTRVSTQALEILTELLKKNAEKS